MSVCPCRAKNHLLTITGARLELSRFEGWLRCGLRARFDCRSLPTMTALALSGCMHTTGPVAVRAAERSRFHGLWPALQPAAAWRSSMPIAAAAPSARFARPLPRRRRGCLRAARRSPMPRRCRRRCRSRLRRGLSSRCRRQAARRGLRPGRPHQHLRDRRRRLDHHAADRRGAGARPDAGGTGRAKSSAKLRNGYIRDPSVAVEIEAYRPFFILGEVAAPGQYPYVPNMTVESAVAIAGGFSPRARRDRVTLTHTDAVGTRPLRGAARHRRQPGRYRAGRRALVLISLVARHCRACAKRHPR